jgi:hypothetical protein
MSWESALVVCLHILYACCASYSSSLLRPIFFVVLGRQGLSVCLKDVRIGGQGSLAASWLLDDGTFLALVVVLFPTGGLLLKSSMGSMKHSALRTCSGTSSRVAFL